VISLVNIGGQLLEFNIDLIELLFLEQKHS